MDKYTLRFIVLILAFAAPGVGNAAPPSNESVAELLRLTGTVDIDRNARLKLLPALQQVAPDMSASFWQDYLNESEDGKLEALTFDVYKQHLSQQDVDGIIAFYQSAPGRKLIESQVAIQQESIEIGKTWGQSVVADVMAKKSALNDK